MDHGKHQIAVGGIHIESSTFSPHRAGEADFAVVRGDALLERYDALSPEAEWIPLVHARALPGGAVEKDFFDSLLAELIARLRDEVSQRDLDGVYLDIHGAMSVDGLCDAEGMLAAEVRKVVGDKVLVSASMDPHGNVSEKLLSNVDLLTSHRMSPHEDAKSTLERATTNLVHCLNEQLRPLRAWVSVPVLLPGEKACTRDEPAKSLYGQLSNLEQRDGIIDAAYWIGYAWADEKRCRGAVVVSGTDEVLIRKTAQELAQAWWEARGDFDFSTHAVDADTALREALASPQRPYFVSDSGDNPTAGGSGDVAYMLDRMLANPQLATGDSTAIWASVVDPAAVAVCVAAGESATVDVQLGGALGWRGPVVSLQGKVTAVSRDDPTAGDTAVIRSGGVATIVTSNRKPFHYIEDFTKLGLDPFDVDVTVVKVGYLVPELFAAAAQWIMALTPGGVDQDIARLGYNHLQRPIYPIDQATVEPDLTALVMRSR